MSSNYMSNNLSRRTFLKRLAGTGVLVATSQLPSFAGNPSPSANSPEDKPDLFPQRGRFQRLSLGYATVEIGLEEPFSLLHITDSHLSDAYESEGEEHLKRKQKLTRTYGGRQEEALRDALTWARQHVEYVLHTGDLIDWQSEANFALVEKYFGEGFLGAVGNHEFKDLSPQPASREEQRDVLQSHYHADVFFRSQIIHGVNFIMLDNAFGTVSEEQVRRFRDEAAKGLPMVLCMHVPFFTEKIFRENARFWRSKRPMSSGSLPEPFGDFKAQISDPVTREFIGYLKTEPLLKSILAGHFHIMTEDQFSPTCREYVTGPGFLFTAREVLFV